MTPHDLGIDALVSDPSILGLEGVADIKREIPLYNPEYSSLTDIDVLYEMEDGGVAIAELKTSRGTRWLKAMRQLSIGSQYVQECYGVVPVCFYVRGGPERFHVVRSESGVGTFEHVRKDESHKLAHMINEWLPMFSDRLPRDVRFYGSD